MNCFVIMPFAPEFDDVYAVIKATVERALSTSNGRCFRLDEARLAGRITDRLLTELQTTTMCVADLTGCSPNVMWEVGYAMALNKPVIFIVQNKQELPFDIKDMQAIEYRRGHLSATLGRYLHQAVIDTVSAGRGPKQSRILTPSPSDEVIAGLRDEVSELKSIVVQAVNLWGGSQPRPKREEGETGHWQSVAGAWLGSPSGIHAYLVDVGGELIAPYCYGGNSYLTGVFFEWRRVGEHWFARFEWVGGIASGFAFLKQESPDLIKGAWWNDSEVMGIDITTPPPMKSGVRTLWRRRRNAQYPAWATKCINEVRTEGFENWLSRQRREMDIQPYIQP